LIYNRDACNASPYLADVTSELMLYGTLAHSHLHQCIKNIRGGAKTETAGRFSVNGHLNLDVVTSESPDLAESCHKGLQWTVLSWRIRDVPGALTLIQSALNRKNEVAMAESAMQCVARLSVLSEKLKTDTGHVDRDKVRLSLSSSMPQFAKSQDFSAFSALL